MGKNGKTLHIFLEKKQKISLLFCKLLKNKEKVGEENFERMTEKLVIYSYLPHKLFRVTIFKEILEIRK